MTRCARVRSLVNTPAARPNSLALARAITSSSLSNSSTDITGPKISRRTMSMSSWQPSNTVGATKNPSTRWPAVSRAPPAMSRAPCARPRAMNPSTFCMCSAYGRPASAADWARRSFEAATICMALVIFCVALVAAMRLRRSFSEGMDGGCQMPDADVEVPTLPSDICPLIKRMSWRNCRPRPWAWLRSRHRGRASRGSR